MPKNLFKKIKKELPIYWNRAWANAGFVNMTKFRYDHVFIVEEKNEIILTDDYQMHIFTDYDPNTITDTLQFCLCFNHVKNKFIIKYLYSENVNDSSIVLYANKSTFTREIDFDFCEWHKTKDPSVFYKFVFPGWVGDLKENKYHIMLDFCTYVSKYSKMMINKEKLKKDFEPVLDVKEFLHQYD